MPQRHRARGTAAATRHGGSARRRETNTSSHRRQPPEGQDWYPAAASSAGIEWGAAGSSPLLRVLPGGLPTSAGNEHEAVGAAGAEHERGGTAACACWCWCCMVLLLRKNDTCTICCRCTISISLSLSSAERRGAAQSSRAREGDLQPSGSAHPSAARAQFRCSAQPTPRHGKDARRRGTGDPRIVRCGALAAFIPSAAAAGCTAPAAARSADQLSLREALSPHSVLAVFFSRSAAHLAAADVLSESTPLSHLFMLHLRCPEKSCLRAHFTPSRRALGSGSLMPHALDLARRRRVCCCRRAVAACACSLAELRAAHVVPPPAPRHARKEAADAALPLVMRMPSAVHASRRDGPSSVAASSPSCLPVLALPAVMVPPRRRRRTGTGTAAVSSAPEAARQCPSAPHRSLHPAGGPLR